MRGLIRFLLEVEAAAKVLDRLNRTRHSTWVVPVAAVVCAGGMFWTAARYNLAQQMSPRAAHTILGNIAGPGGGGGVPADIVFASSYTSGTGNSRYAQMDSARTNAWPAIGDYGNGPTVVDTALFASGTAIRVPTGSGQKYLEGVNNSYWTAVAVGDYISVRYQIMFIQGGDVSLEIQMPSGFSQLLWNRAGNELIEGTVHEIQVRVYRESADSYSVDLGVFDFSGGGGSRVLLYDESDFTNGGDNLGSVLHAAADASDGATAVWTSLGGWTTGLNGAMDSNTHPSYFDNAVANPNWSSKALGFVYYHANCSDGSPCTGTYAYYGPQTVAKGAIGDSEWPLREWTTAEEAWEPS